MSTKPPLVGIPTCFREVNERVMYTAVVRYPHAVVDAAGCLPMLIPAIGEKLDIDALLDTIDGLLLTGSPSNVEPHHYEGPPSREGTLHDPDRDATTLPLIREAVRRVNRRARTEISGGVVLDRMSELASTGADFVSVGALTHSAPAIDISFELEPL